ncbi:hypothetical protein M422DRAFT_775867 [Sphaerobolus stellatus SS14]|nr:hypothetical protein M422DRAFT_775867 [Sphaerobolus stellatus SS14]
MQDLNEPLLQNAASETSPRRAVVGFREEHREYIAEKIRNIWTCHLEDHGICLLTIDGQHYILSEQDLQTWVEAIHEGEATVRHPPLSLSHARGYTGSGDAEGGDIPHSIILPFRRLRYATSVTASGTGGTSLSTVIGPGYYAGRGLHWLGSRSLSGIEACVHYVRFHGTGVINVLPRQKYDAWSIGTIVMHMELARCSIVDLCAIPREAHPSRDVLVGLHTEMNTDIHNFLLLLATAFLIFGLTYGIPNPDGFVDTDTQLFRVLLHTQTYPKLHLSGLTLEMMFNLSKLRKARLVTGPPLSALHRPHEVGAFGLCAYIDPRFYEIFSGSTGITGLFNGLNEAVEKLTGSETTSDALWFQVLDTLYALHEIFLQVPGNYMNPEMGISLFKFTLLPFPPPMRQALKHALIDNISALISSFPATVEHFNQEQFNIVKVSLQALQEWRDFGIDGAPEHNGAASSLLRKICISCDAVMTDHVVSTQPSSEYRPAPVPDSAAKTGRVTLATFQSVHREYISSKIEDIWRCAVSGHYICILTVDGGHYELRSQDMKIWVDAIEEGEATVRNPPPTLIPAGEAPDRMVTGRSSGYPQIIGNISVRQRR